MQCVPDAEVRTDDVLGLVFPGDLHRLSEADLVDGGDAALVLSAVLQVLDGVGGVMQVPGHVAAHPVLGLALPALHHVPEDGASPAAGGLRPREADGAVGGVGHGGVHHGAGGSCSTSTG